MSKTTLAGALKVLVLILGFVASAMFGVTPDAVGRIVLTPDASWIAGAVTILYGALSFLQAKLTADAKPAAE